MLQHQGEEPQKRATELLSSEELSEVLNTAIKREQSSTESGATTLEEALEIARQANIPEEHVLTAVEELRLRKERSDEESMRMARRSERRLLVKAKRKAQALFGIACALGISVVGAVVSQAIFPFLLFLGLAVLLMGGRWLLLPVSDAEADLHEPPARPGICRVCGREAHTPRSTFCEEHRFRPSS